MFGVAEDFDESLEHYDTITWINQGSESDNADIEAEECVDAVEVAISAFDKIESRARVHFVKTLAMILSASPELQRAALGRPYYISEENMEVAIEKLIETLDESEYHRSIPKNFELLMEIMAGDWAKGK